MLATQGIDNLRDEIAELLKSVQLSKHQTDPVSSPKSTRSTDHERSTVIDNNKLHIIGLRSSLRAAQERIELLSEENARLKNELKNCRRTVETRKIIQTVADRYKIGNREKTKLVNHLKEEVKSLKSDKERMTNELATVSRIIKTVLIK